MKKHIFSFFVIIAITFLSTGLVKSQTDTEFWFVVPEVTLNHGSPGGIPANLRFATFNLSATVTISMPANPMVFPDIVINIPANSTGSVNLSDWIYAAGVEQNKLENKTLNASGINNFGLHITSTSLITAYYEISNSLNSDIWTLKGRNALGTNFFTPFQTHGDNGSYAAPDATQNTYSAIDIVATENNTSVTVTPSKTAGYGNAGAAIEANTPQTFILNKGQTLSIYPQGKSRVVANRLAGSHITSDKPIAISLKDDSIIHPSGGCRDVVGDQIVPVTLTGADHIVMRTFLNNSDYIYVVATQNATPIYVDDALVATLNAGQQYQIVFPTTYATSYMKVTSRLLATDPYKPIYVFHIGGFGCEQGGAIIPTIDVCTGSTQVAFARSNPNPFYLTIMVRDGAQDGFLVNGETRNDLLPPAAFVLVPGTSWRVARLGSFLTTQFNVGQNFISNTKDLFHLGIINGNAGTTCMYGYFSNFNKFKADALVFETGGPGATLCNGDSVQLYANGGVSYKWTPTDFLNDPFSNAPIARNVTNSIKYKVVVSGACGLKDSAEIDIIVSPYLEANFTVDKIAGTAPLTIKITNSSVNAYQNEWDFNGDGDFADPGEGINNSASFTHIFENNTNDDVINNITLYVSDASYVCSKTAKRSINVYPKLKVDFTVDKYSDCSPSTFNFTNTTSSQAKSFEWDLNNDGTVDFITKEIPSQLFTNTSSELQVRDIPVKLTATDSTGFKSSIVRTIRIYPNATASIIIDNNGNSLGCSPLNLNFSSTTTNATIFDWQIDGNSFNNQSSAFYTFNNNELSSITKSISLNVSNIFGCSASQTANITIQPFIKASFLIDKVESCSPFNLTVLNDSKGSINSFFWDRDGDVATGPSGFEYSVPTPTGWSLPYTNTTVTNTPKSVTIKLKVTNAGGCSDVASNTITINPPVSASIVTSNNGNPLGCSPLNMDFEAITINATIYQWLIDGNAINNTTTGSYTFENFGATAISRLVSFTASNNYGCSSTQNQNINIQPFVNADIALDKESGCTPLTVNFINTSSIGASSFQWDFENDGGVDFSTKNIPTQVFNNPTVTNTPRIIPVKLVAKNDAGCSDERTRDITINPKPLLNLGSDTINTKLPYQINSNISDVTYLWNTGAITPSITVDSYGTYSLYVTNSFDCSAFDKVVVMLATSIGGDNELSASIHYYPNPAIDILSIKIEAKDPNTYKIELIDQFSRVVKFVKSHKTTIFFTTINIQDLTPGIYLLKVSGNSGSITYKVIIQ